MPKSQHRKKHTQKVLAYKKRQVDSARAWTNFLRRESVRTQAEADAETLAEVQSRIAQAEEAIEAIPETTEAVVEGDKLDFTIGE